MKKYKFLLFFIISALLLSFNISAECDSWYFVRSGHEKPPIAKEFSYLSEYGGYYLDEKSTDEDKVIYLTFDAGYENGNVEKVVDILNRHKAKGTFFILENLCNRNPELVKKMADNGHTVANHTATHPNLANASKYEIEKEIKQLEKACLEKTGVKVAKLFRPPEGKLTESELKSVNELGYKTIMWSFAYADWDNQNQPNPENSIKKILENTHNGMIILLHPTSNTNAEILDKLLTEWENEGYRIGDINEMVENNKL